MFIYSENDTMKLIGKQNYSMITDKGNRRIHDVIDTHYKHKEYGLLQMSMDIYLLGYLEGRKKRGAKC